jgi:hypothetical protein
MILREITRGVNQTLEAALIIRRTGRIDNETEIRKSRSRELVQLRIMTRMSGDNIWRKGKMYIQSHLQ